MKTGKIKTLEIPRHDLDILKYQKKSCCPFLASVLICFDPVNLSSLARVIKPPDW